MAKPEHTAYMVMADFDNIEKGEHIVNHDGPVGLDPTCITSGMLKRSLGRNRYNLYFNTPENSHITFGYDKAEALLKQCRSTAKQQFKKGQRPTFFLRKMTMSEFMSHKEFEVYSSSTTIRKIFKKYLLLDLLK